VDTVRVMTARESLWAKLQRLLFGPNPGMGRAPVSRHGDEMPYEILLEGREPIEAWSVCTVCMNADRTASVHRPRWRCLDCGSLRIINSRLRSTSMRIHLRCSSGTCASGSR